MAEETLRTLDRALEVLRAFGRGSPEPTVAQVAERVAMPRSVVVRILATLERAGFVEHASGNSRKFRIGLDACEVGTLYFAGNLLLRGSEDVLHDIAERTGFTAYLGTLHGAEIVIWALCEGRTPVRFIWHAGDRLPVATAARARACGFCGAGYRPRPPGSAIRRGTTGGCPGRTAAAPRNGTKRANSS